MGTSLTGLTPATTYDALIKVGDNGPLSATAKVLSDGLGNDSPLAMSTSLVGIGTATPAYKLDTNGGFADGTNNYVATFHSNTGASGDAFVGIGAYRSDGLGAFRNAYINAVAPSGGSGNLGLQIGGGNVGIGTSSPSTTLHLDASGGATIRLQRTSASANRFDVGTDGTNMEFNVRDTGNFTFGGTGAYLRLVSGTGGIQFNGDTAAANALDDYEEGTFTLSAVPATSGTISLSTSSARYTKIGRQVFIQAFITVGSVSSPIGTAILLQGLPFTIANDTNAGGSSLVVWADANASYVKTGLPGFYLGNTTQIYAPINAALVEANDEFFITMTYTV